MLGDALTGPFFEHLLTFPGTQQPLDDLFTKGLREQLTKVLAAALVHVRELEATVGVTLADLLAKQAAMAKLNAALAPFHTLAAVWAGGVMLGGRACDDVGYGDLTRSIADHGVADPAALSHPTMGRMLATGIGATGGAQAGPDAPRALPYDLTFPEVFFPTGSAVAKRGFDVVLGNPPWDAIQFKSKEFFAAFDFEILSAPTKRERERMEVEALQAPAVRALLEHYKEDFEQQKRANDVLYRYQKVQIEGDLAGRQLDAFRVFMERNAQLLAPTGCLTGVVVLSAFHANEGATGVRRLYLEEMGLRCCYSFENRRKLFEIDSRFKFAIILASRTGPTLEFPCAFYLHDDEWLFQPRAAIRYSLAFVRRTGGPHLSIIELRCRMDQMIANQMHQCAQSFVGVTSRLGVRLQKSPAALDISKYSRRFEEAPRHTHKHEHPVRGSALLEDWWYTKARHFAISDDRWGSHPRYLLPLAKANDLPLHVERACDYQIAIKEKFLLNK
ncbi:MAG: hypothetical protein U0610_21675 [bacterium]